MNQFIFNTSDESKINNIDTSLIMTMLEKKKI